MTEDEKTRLLNEYSDQADRYEKLFESAARSGDLNAALNNAQMNIRCYESMIALNGLPEVYLRDGIGTMYAKLGDLFMQHGKTADAAGYFASSYNNYRRAISCKPQVHDYIYGSNVAESAADLYQKMGKSSEANAWMGKRAAMFNELIQRFPESEEADYARHELRGGSGSSGTSGNNSSSASKGSPLTTAVIAIVVIVLLIFVNPFQSCSSRQSSTSANTHASSSISGNSSASTSGSSSTSTSGSSSTTSTNPFANAKKGELITFGTYGGESIQWRVLEVSGGMATVITEKVVESQSFASSYTATTWESSALRSWMNGKFYNSFSDSEKKFIVITDVINSANSQTGTSSGSSTQDYIYALSANEAEKFFSSDSDRLAYPTSHAKSDGVDVISQSGASPWWLRTSGNKSNDATYVWGRTGAVDYNGYGVDQSTYGARPVMHVTTTA